MPTYANYLGRVTRSTVWGLDPSLCLNTDPPNPPKMYSVPTHSNHGVGDLAQNLFAGVKQCIFDSHVAWWSIKSHKTCSKADGFEKRSDLEILGVGGGGTTWHNHFWRWPCRVAHDPRHCCMSHCKVSPKDSAKNSVTGPEIRHIVAQRYSYSKHMDELNEWLH